jgi:hypothetical protein
LDDSGLDLDLLRNVSCFSIIVHVNRSIGYILRLSLLRAFVLRVELDIARLLTVAEEELLMCSFMMFAQAASVSFSDLGFRNTASALIGKFIIERASL